MKRIVILGAGTGGTSTANRLRKSYNEDELEITVIDQDNVHIYQPGLLFVPFGIYDADEIIRPRKDQLVAGINYVQKKIYKVEAEQNQVHLEGGDILSYDVLVVATGTQILPEETEGMTGEAWQKSIFDFDTLDGASKLATKLSHWQGGRLVVNVVDMPIKCPVAPLEFVFLADWFFQEKGIRDKVDIVYVTPLDGAFTKPVASKALQKLLEDKNIAIETEFNTGEVDGTNGKIISYDERIVDFDLLVSVPVHGGSDFVGRSPGLGDELNFVLTNKETLQSSCAENIFAIGDATTLPTSKAGSVTHFETEILVDNIRSFLNGETLEGKFDGHANCFIETGFHQALLIDFNYETEPLPGKFPFKHGPMSLLKETKLNHMGKLMFHWAYWNILLPGRPMPGIPTQMSMKGKKLVETGKEK